MTEQFFDREFRPNMPIRVITPDDESKSSIANALKSELGTDAVKIEGIIASTISPNDGFSTRTPLTEYMEKLAVEQFGESIKMIFCNSYELMKSAVTPARKDLSNYSIGERFDCIVYQ